MGYLQGLKGVSGDRKIDCLFIQKGSDIEVILNNNMAATCAFRNGALNIWYDDESRINVEALRHYATLDHQILDDIEDAIKWVDWWLPEIK